MQCALIGATHAHSVVCVGIHRELGILRLVTDDFRLGAEVHLVSGPSVLTAILGHTGHRHLQTEEHVTDRPS